MVALVGTYQNDSVKLDKEYHSNYPVKVIVTFLEEVRTTSKKGLFLNDFLFKNLAHFKGSFCEAVIEERRLELRRDF